MHCVIHIGTEKTGTTLIQNWLYENRAALSKQRIFLSEALGGRNNRIVSALFTNQLDDWARAQNITTKKQKDEFFAGFEDRFQGEVAEAQRDHDIFIITSEHFHSRVRSPNEVTALRDFLLRHFETVRVVCYFREQSDMALSLYSTSLKGDGKRSLKEFLSGVSGSDYYYNFKEIADNWSGVFGRKNCDFRIYARDRFDGGDVRRDFSLTVPINIDAPDISLASTSANESLSLVEGIALRKINNIIPYWKGAGGINERNIWLKRLIQSRPRVRVGKMPREDLQEVWKRFEQTNRDFFKDYFPNDRPFASPKPFDPQSGLTPADSVFAAIDAICDVFVGEIGRLLSVYDGDAAFLRDLAARCEREGLISPEDISSLRSIASRAANPQKKV